MDEADKEFMRIVNTKFDENSHAAIDDAVTKLAQEFAKPNEMMLSEFSKYEILFNREFKQKVLNEQLTPEEDQEYRELSNEFLSKLDPYKPLILIDDRTGKRFPPIPPLYRRLTAGTDPNYNKITGEIMTEYSAIVQHDDGNAVGVSAYQQTQAMQKIANVLLARETLDSIHKDSKACAEMSQNFLNEYNKNKESPNEMNHSDSKVQSDCDISTSGDDFDFDL